MLADLEHETWRSSILGTIVVKKYDRRGEVVEEVIPGNRSFQITTDERLFNQDLAATPEQDPFRNGMMQPVRLLDGTEDKAAIASNPNLLSETDMELLFKAHFKTFESRVKQITNLTTLTRIREVASEVDATLKQVAIIDNRLKDVQAPVATRTSEPIASPSVPAFRSTSELRPSTP